MSVALCAEIPNQPHIALQTFPRHSIFPCWNIRVSTATSDSIIDQINKKPRFSTAIRFENRFSCGLLFEAGACRHCPPSKFPKGKYFCFLYSIKVCVVKYLIKESSESGFVSESRDDHKGSQRQFEPRVVVSGTKENAMGERARWTFELFMFYISYSASFASHQARSRISLINV